MHIQEERGSAILEFIVIAVAVLMPLVYIVMSIATVHAASMASSQAVREATRAFTMAANPNAAVTMAQQAAQIALANHGFTLDPRTLTVQCNGGCLNPGSSVSVALDWQVPLPWLPQTLRGPTDVRVTAAHTLPVDAYRSSP
jgi:Flp pilus assembly protein TadG